MLVAIVGVDCSGKSTQIRKLVELYKKMKINVNSVSLGYKPTALNLSNYESKIAHENDKFPLVLSGDHYATAYCCDFFNHYCTNILPLLKKKSNPLILSDRFTICYKAYADAINAKSNISHTFLDEIIIEPDLTICLDLDIDEVMKRLSLRKEKRAKDETFEILNSLIKFYRKSMRNVNNGYILNANVPIENLTQSIFKLIEKEYDV